MLRILIFLAGALFGGALVFVLRPLTGAEPAYEPLAQRPPPLPRAAASAETRVAPLAPEVIAPPAVAPPGVEPEPAAAESPAPELPPPVIAVPQLMVPVAGIKASQLSDTFTDSRGGTRVHDAIDIMAPLGTPVVAADDGSVVKLFNSIAGGLTIYQFDPGEKFAYYYAHLARYAPGLVEGQPLKRGELIGYVGYSGNASAVAPHLHFAVFVLSPEKRWWQGAAINPYPLFMGAE